jgi:hypothetical protein
VQVRVREEGHVFFADALVVPRHERRLLQEIERTTAAALELDWRLHDLVLMPVRELSSAGPRERPALEHGSRASAAGARERA